VKRESKARVGLSAVCLLVLLGTSPAMGQTQDGPADTTSDVVVHTASEAVLRSEGNDYALTSLAIGSATASDVVLDRASASPAVASEETGSAGYQLTWWTADGGGGTMVGSGAYTLSGTAGQPDAGVVEGNGYTLSGGFWTGGGMPYRVYLPLVIRASP
jgi:hypothetical protein